MPEKTDKTFNDWSMRVLEELVALNAKTENLAQELDDKYTLLQNGIEKINETLSGNGDPSKGLIVRVDRLEQNEGRRTWLLRATIVASLGAILATLSQWIKSFF